MQFIIDRDILHLAEYGTEEYYFDYDSYRINRTKPDIYSVRFIHIPEITAMRAFINSQNDRQLIEHFRGIDDDRFSSHFLTFFDDDGINSSHWHEFEEKYYLDAVTGWCEENGISYRIIL